VNGTAWIINSGATITEPAAPVAGQQRRYRLTVINPTTGTGANTVYTINSI
jgi:hypothetical protein